jgi:hypothetical protein
MAEVGARVPATQPATFCAQCRSMLCRAGANDTWERGAATTTTTVPNDTSPKALAEVVRAIVCLLHSHGRSTHHPASLRVIVTMTMMTGLSLVGANWNPNAYRSEPTRWCEYLVRGMFCSPCKSVGHHVWTIECGTAIRFPMLRATSGQDSTRTENQAPHLVLVGRRCTRFQILDRKVGSISRNSMREVVCREIECRGQVWRPQHNLAIGCNPLVEQMLLPNDLLL